MGLWRNEDLVQWIYDVICVRGNGCREQWANRKMETWGNGCVKRLVYGSNGCRGVMSK